MKKLEDYILYDKNDEYDYISIVKDFWKTGFYSNKVELVGAIMKFSKGHLNPSIIIETFNKIKDNL